MIALTFDVDWVDEKTLLPICEVLEKNKLKATFFITGNHKCLKHPLFEINPHINFDASYELYKKEFKKYRKIAPKAVGVRNHSLYYTERLRKIWEGLGVKYTSNLLMPLVKGIQPFYLTNKILEVPIYFLDYWFMECYGNKADFNLKSLKLKEPGLKVMDFHPVHLNLNTPNLQYYRRNSKYYHKPVELRDARYKGRGVETLFLEVIDYIVTNKIKVYKLNEIYKYYRKNKTVTNLL